MTIHPLQNFLMKLLLLSLQLFFATCLFAMPSSIDLNRHEHSSGSLYFLTEPSQSHSNIVEVSWSSVPDAYAYFLVVTENGSPVTQTIVYGTNKKLNNLLPGHSYHCTVSSIINGGQSTDFIIVMDIMP